MHFKAVVRFLMQTGDSFTDVLSVVIVLMVVRLTA